MPLEVSGSSRALTKGRAMAPSPPSTQGSYLGETQLHDGVVWTWDGTEWIRGRQPGVLRRDRRRDTGS